MTRYSIRHSVNIKCAFLLSSICSVVLIAKPSQAQSTVNWVHVPGGMGREDCIHTIPNGSKFDVASGNVMDQSGAVMAHYDDCPGAAFIRDPQGSGGGSIPNSGGWVVAASDHMDLASGRNITSMTGTWNVPPIPSNNEGQTVYLWNGVSDDSQVALLQPVLQFGSSKAGECTNSWGIASWALFPTGIEHTPIVCNVNQGDPIQGTTSNTQNGVTLDWTVFIEDEFTGAWASAGELTQGYQWSWAWGGILEADGVNTCADFPDGNEGSIAFYDTQLLNNGGASVGWANSLCANSSSCEPMCSGSCNDYFGPSCNFNAYEDTNSIIFLSF